MTETEAIENIDIGGPTMIRAAAKNHRFVAVVVKPESYDAVLAELEESGRRASRRRPGTGWPTRRSRSRPRYDAAISRWFGMRYEAFPGHWVMAHEKFLDLSYGENPHQKAALYVEVGARSHVLSRVSKLHGGRCRSTTCSTSTRRGALLDEFEQAACVIVKHNNPCGVGRRRARRRGLREGPRLRSAVGIRRRDRASTARSDRALAERLHEHFIEVLIAPGYEEDALEVLKQKEAVRILEAAEQRSYEPRERDVKRVRGGLLVQEPDRIDESRESMQVVTEASPSERQWEDLWFAWKVCRHVRSNAIVIAKDGATLGIGAGQMSRVDSVRIAIEKAREARGAEADRAARRLGGGLGRVLPLPRRARSSRSTPAPRR